MGAAGFEPDRPGEPQKPEIIDISRGSLLEDITRAAKSLTLGGEVDADALRAVEALGEIMRSLPASARARLIESLAGDGNAGGR